jgi:DNA-directed RNA polymerase subunit M/transcription elongation factor TFIIS
MAVTYLVSPAFNCPECQSNVYLYTIPAAILNTNTGSNVSGTVYHCDSCQHNFQSLTEF